MNCLEGRRYLTLIIALLLMVLIVPGYTQSSETPDAAELLNKIDDLYRGDSSKGTLTMSITTEHWSRELSLEYWSKGKDRSLFRITAPKKEKGTATLRVENDIWNYLPKVNRTIKVPSSMMGQSWMGSHFTNDDLVKETRMADDYDFEITFQGERGGKQVIELTCIPKENAAIVWGKVVVHVEDETYIPIEMVYYDEDLDPSRTMTFGRIQDLGDRVIPTEMKVVPFDKPNEWTIVTYDDIVFDIEIKDDFFSLRNLQD